MPTLEPTAVSRPRAPDFVPGYRLEKMVGKGGMGEVHRATQLSLGRPVAVKLLASELADDENFVSRFQKEAATLAALSHPNIVSIVDKGKAESTWFLVMELVDGPSLREMMGSPLFDATSALKVTLEICRAIEYAHSRGVIHRDLKPENILFAQQAGGLAKVTDFGLASFLDDASSRYNLTQTNMSMGTLSYMAPEQRVDAKTADGRADIFSLGVILYELLVGEVPLGTFDPPSHKRPALDPRLDAIVQRCLKPDPADRYQKLSELIADLAPLVELAQAPKAIAGKDGRGKGTARSFLRGLVVAALLLGTGAVGGAVAWHRYERLRPPAETFGGAALVQELPNLVGVTAQGKLERSDRGASFVIGEGPDPLAFLAAGREVRLEGDAIEFLEGAASGIGRLRVDMTDLGGDSLRLSARLSTVSPQRSDLEEWAERILGPTPLPEASLLFTGSAGRYVALTRSADAPELALEWALEERRGRLVFPIELSDAGAEAPLLELAISDGGELRAHALSGKKRLPLGEPVQLGEEWAKGFGEEPRPALACVGETCRFERVSFVAARRPPPPPPPRVEPPKPPPAPVATVQPARATKPKVTTPPLRKSQPAPVTRPAKTPKKPR